MPGGRSVRLSATDIRRDNVALICALLRDRGRLTRTELVRASGLARPTVTAIVRNLIDDGTVTEIGSAPALGVSGGRPGTLIQLEPTARIVAAVRLRGSDSEVILGDLAGRPLASRRAGRPPEARGATALVTAFGQQILDLVASRPDLGRLAAVAVSLPGSVDRTRGLWTLPARPGWRDVPVAEMIAAAVDAPVSVINVAAAALIGQLTDDPVQPSSAVLVFVGKGVGSAVTVNGRLVDGVTGSAGELGHCKLPGVDERCSCGKRGCVEAVTSAVYVRREYRRITGRRAPTSLSAMELAAEPDVAALLDGVAERLGLAASWLVNLINPDTVYLAGGSLTLDSQHFYDTFARALRKAAHAPDVDGLRIRHGEPDATAAGTLHLAAEMLPRHLRPVLSVVC